MRRFSTSHVNKLIDGRLVAKQTRTKIKRQVTEFTDMTGRGPGLAVLLVGNRPDSAAYVLSKTNTCRRLGMPSFQYNFPTNVREKELFQTLDYLNSSSNIDGILVQLPLPDHLDEDKIIQYISPNKDVDGLNLQNVGALYHWGDAPLKACTPAGVMKLLDSCGDPFYPWGDEEFKLSGKHAVVIGRSDIVGKPMAALLLANNCTVTICHSRTKDMEKHLKMADIVVAAVGRANFVRGEWLKPGCTVIDVGINKVEGSSPKDVKLVGDVHFESCAEVAGRITPVPGGVGPMTIAMLLQNTVNSAWSRHIKNRVEADLN